MAYDEELALRVRALLGSRNDVSEKKMFGGIAFMVGGHMVAGVVMGELMVRVGAAAYDTLLGRAHARPMDFTGRPLKGFLYVGAAGVKKDGDLKRWLDHGVSHAESLPPKVARRRRPRPPAKATRGRRAAISRG